MWLSVAELVVPDSFSFHAPGFDWNFDWNFCCSQGGVENPCSRRVSAGILVISEIVVPDLLETVFCHSADFV